MPMMIAFEKASYSPGEVVSGHVVVIRSTTPQKVKGLSIRILGRANRILSEIENPIRSSKKELYFDDKVDIFGHGESNSHLISYYKIMSKTIGWYIITEIIM